MSDKAFRLVVSVIAVAALLVGAKLYSAAHRYTYITEPSGSALRVDNYSGQVCFIGGVVTRRGRGWVDFLNPGETCPDNGMNPAEENPDD